MLSAAEISPGGLRLRRESEEVLYVEGPLATLADEDIAWLKKLAASNSRQRIRICSHAKPEDTLHEMIIVHTREAYVRPHKHLDRCESFHVISGEVDVIVFTESGSIKSVFRMGPYGSGKPFYYRLNQPIFHMLIVRSEVLVFHECTTGPFRREGTLFAPWSPEEAQSASRADFLAKVEAEMAGLTGLNK
jgi:cupin fold WbuC family metalloprotein